MFEQIITERDVRYLIHKHELYDEVNDFQKESLSEVIENIYSKITSDSFNCDIRKTIFDDNCLYMANNIETKIFLRYLNQIIKNVYKVKQTNRNRIIKQLISILYSNNDFYIIKLDISSFYESINTEYLIQKLKKDGIISFQNILSIENVIHSTTIKGLPRGITFSASLSEIYLKDFDKYLRQNEAVTYFARYVDDIIIISSKDISDSIIDILSKSPYELKINKDKTKVMNVISDQNKINNFNFLGYNFKINSKCSNKNKRSIIISIQDSKIEKIKRRIIKSTMIFLKDNNFSNYYNRLKLLFGNYQLDSNENGILMTGIYYNYQFITEMSSLNKLNQFKNFLITGNSRISKQLQARLSVSQKQQLLKLNICKGFNSKFNINLSKQKIIKLTQVLKYV